MGRCGEPIAFVEGLAKHRDIAGGIMTDRCDRNQRTQVKEGRRPNYTYRFCMNYQNHWVTCHQRSPTIQRCNQIISFIRFIWYELDDKMSLQTYMASAGMLLKPQLIGFCRTPFSMQGPVIIKHFLYIQKDKVRILHNKFTYRDTILYNLLYSWL